MSNRKTFHLEEVLKMLFLDSSTQQYITNPTLLLQPIRANFISVVGSPSVLVGGGFLLALAYFFYRLFMQIRSKHGEVLKLDLLNALKSSLKSNTWSSWVTPLTGAGGLLGLIVLVRTNEVFTELSLLFGALLLLASLVSQIMKGCPGTVLSTLLTLWAAFGELLATLSLLLTLNLSSPLISWMLRGIVILVLVLLVIYCKQQSGKQTKLSSQEQAVHLNDKQVGSHSNGQPAHVGQRGLSAYSTLRHRSVDIHGQSK
jgi:hypothetical protein